MQVALREQAAKLFCLSLTRNPEGSAIHVSCMHVNIFILIIVNVLYTITRIFFINEGSSWYGGG